MPPIRSSVLRGEPGRSTRLVLAMFLGWILAFSNSHAAKVKPDVADLPPHPNSSAVTVYRNAPIVVRLSAVTSSTTQLKFEIRTKPKFGTLSEITPVTGESNAATVVYTPNPGADSVTDRFLFTAEVPGGRTSSPAAVDIEILTPEAKLEVLGPVQFKRVQVGTVGYAKFSVRNNGRATFRGELEFLSPFAADRRELTVGPGETEQVGVEFRPLTPGRIGTYLQLQANEKTSVLGIFAEAIAPFQISDNTVMLSDIPIGGMRKGRLQLSNLLDKKQVIAINAGLNLSKPSTELKFPNKVELEPNGTAEVLFELPGDIIQGIEETLTLSTDLYSRELSISARATPGKLVLEDYTSGVLWDFGKVEVEEKANPKQFTFKNYGGSPVVATVRSEPPFVISGIKQNLELKSGEIATLTVDPETEIAGVHQGELRLEWSGGEVSIPLSMTVEVISEPADPSNTADVTPVRPVEREPDPKEDSGTEVANVPEKPSIAAEAPRGVLSGNFDGETKAESIKNSYARYYGISLTDEPMHPDVPSATNLKLVEGDHESVKISFTPAKGDINGYDIEMAQMFLDTSPGSSGQIEKRWIIWPGESENVGRTESGDIMVKLEPMMPATEYQFRIVARDQNNRRALPSEIYVVTTGMYVPIWKRILYSPWLKWVIAGAAILFVWRLLAARRDENAQRGKVNVGSDSGGIKGMLEGVRGAIFR